MIDKLEREEGKLFDEGFKDDVSDKCKTEVLTAMKKTVAVRELNTKLIQAIKADNNEEAENLLKKGAETYARDSSATK